VTEEQYKVIRFLVDCVNSKGGVYINARGLHAPVHAPDWQDLGATYVLACRVLGCDPIVVEALQLRDHGLGNLPQEVAGAPSWTPCADNETCPNCKGRLTDVALAVRSPLLRGGTGVTRYKGCPACPWAGPALTVADAATH
jgi:hypothetical protein